MQITLKDNQDVVTLVQITDCHLGDVAGEELLGMNTDASLADVVALVQQEQQQVDLLLATGDLSNGGSESSYRRFAQMTSDLAEHTLWLPGNHDDLATMQQVFTDGRTLPKSVQVGPWQIIMLDSRIPGAVGGHMAESEMNLLELALEACTDRHALVCLHHHPIDIGCAWLDSQRVSNADDFFALLDRFSHVRGVVWGHIHQQIDRERNGVKLMASPSTCIQFAPAHNTFKLDPLNPGYRWLRLHKDGSLDSGVSRTSRHFEIDYDYAGGYE